MTRRTLAWALSALALLAVCATAALREPDASAAFRLGSVLGALLLALLVGVVVRSLAVRAGSQQRRLWSPWVLVIATGFALLVAVGTAARNVARPAECETPTRSADQLLGALPPGLSTQPAAQELVDDVTKSLGKLEPERVTAIAIARGREPRAALVSIEVDERIRRRDLVAGAEEAAGAPGTDVPLGEADGRMIVTADGAAAVFGVAGPCAAAIVYGATAPVAQRVAEGLRVPAS